MPGTMVIVPDDSRLKRWPVSVTLVPSTRRIDMSPSRKLPTWIWLPSALNATASGSAP